MKDDTAGLSSTQQLDGGDVDVWCGMTRWQVASHAVFIQTVIRKKNDKWRSQLNRHVEEEHMAPAPLGRRSTQQDECWGAGNIADFNLSN